MNAMLVVGVTLFLGTCGRRAITPGWPLTVEDKGLIDVDVGAKTGMGI